MVPYYYVPGYECCGVFSHTHGIGLLIASRGKHEMARKRILQTGPNEQFAERLRLALVTAELSPDNHTYMELGKELSLSGAMVGYLLNGDKLPGLDKAVFIARRTMFCTEWLLSGRGPKRPDEMGIFQQWEDLSTEHQDLVSSLIRALPSKVQS
jgi:hypothetical protein